MLRIRNTYTISESLLWMLLFLTLSFLIFCHFSLRPIGVDAGLHMYGSLLISKGLFPYKYLWNNKPPLIYILGSAGFFSKENPFVGVRLLELFAYVLNLVLLNKILNFLRVRQSSAYLLCFSVIYLSCWDGGFLTETFTIPFNFLAFYLFLKKTKYFEFFGALLWIICFLLKQNAVSIITGIILIDLFSDYRQRERSKKLLFYFLSFLAFISLCLVSFKVLGVWNDFLDQVFIYNSEYANHPSFFKAVVNHLIHNSFLSIKGISLLMIFNVSILITLQNYWKTYKTGQNFNLRQKVLIGSMMIYLGSYIFVYISGRTDAHYFMLLIVPATIIGSHYVVETRTGKIALAALLVYVVFSNVKSIRYYGKVYADMETTASYIKANSNSNDFILIAGFGNQYLHIISDRLSPTRFVMPLLESSGYNSEYTKTLSGDLSIHPPLFIILNKNNYRSLNANDFYTRTIMEKLKNYFLGFQNSRYLVYRRGSISRIN